MILSISRLQISNTQACILEFFGTRCQAIILCTAVHSFPGWCYWLQAFEHYLLAENFCTYSSSGVWISISFFHMPTKHLHLVSHRHLKINMFKIHGKGLFLPFLEVSSYSISHLRNGPNFYSVAGGRNWFNLVWTFNLISLGLLLNIGGEEQTSTESKTGAKGLGGWRVKRAKGRMSFLKVYFYWY